MSIFLLCGGSANSATVPNVFAAFARVDPLVGSVKLIMNTSSTYFSGVLFDYFGPEAVFLLRADVTYHYLNVTA